MRSFTDAKAMARSLRSALGDRQVELSHGECLDIVARQFGLDNWNVLSAKVDAADGGKPAEGATDGIRLIDVIPILRIFDVAKAKEFYVDFLGFTIDWEHRFGDNFPLYAQVSRAGLKLHLSEHHGDASPGSALRIQTNDLDGFHRELTDKRYRYARPGIETMPWGTRDMSVKDPFGNRLTFTSADQQST